MLDRFKKLLLNNFRVKNGNRRALVVNSCLPMQEMWSSIPGSGRSPGEGNSPLQYSCLENSMGRGAWWATVLGVMKSQTWLSTRMHPFHRWGKQDLTETTWRKAKEEDKRENWQGTTVGGWPSLLACCYTWEPCSGGVLRVLYYEMFSFPFIAFHRLFTWEAF